MRTKAISGVLLRKGAWSHEEDNLLRKCIEKYGEGKWHQVPIKAGLNRCRKSCRLRWLNYLKPDIKRGEFAVEEVDLLIRLHKLLGNRWSLIAGRIPGRTANDVKNYWNTHQQKKATNTTPEKAKPEDRLVAKTTIFKPRARAFSKRLHCSIGQKPTNHSSSIHSPSQNNISGIRMQQVAAADDGISQWWDELFGDQKEIGGVGWCFGSTNKEVEEEPITSAFWADQLTATQELGENLVQEGPNHDFSELDMDVWGLLNSELGDP